MFSFVVASLAASASGAQCFLAAKESYLCAAELLEKAVWWLAFAGCIFIFDESRPLREFVGGIYAGRTW